MNTAPKNKSLDGLYRAVGQAISNWAAIENQLHQVFGICTSLVAMQPGGGFSFDTTIPSAVLDSIEGFHGKLLMIRAALQAALRDLDEEAKDLLNEGLAAINAVRTLHLCRNKLAHWTACRHQNQDGSTKTVKLEPPPYSSKSDEGVRETDIDQWTDNFIDTNRTLSIYVERLASYRGLQRRHLELATSQVRCTLPNDPTLLEHLRRELSGYL